MKATIEKVKKVERLCLRPENQFDVYTIGHIVGSSKVPTSVSMIASEGNPPEIRGLDIQIEDICKILGKE